MILLPWAMIAQQLPNAGFEDWSGDKFDNKVQPKSWNASNVEQVGFKFNFAHQESGHTGSYSMMVQDQDVGAAGITETSPGYFSLGKPWVYVESLTKISEATAGTAGSINWKYRPDSMSVWIKRTGNNVDKEDFYLLYYAWSGTAVGNKYKGKNGKCTSVTKEDEESDVRYELNGNECGTQQKANQIAEGMWREKKQYSNWTKVTVPIYYFNNDVPTKMNIIFSASNYPNYRANSGLYAGNSLYVDDVELIYSSKIQKLYIGGKEWKGFDPNSTEVQSYSLGETATSIPEITARRGAGSITNAHGKTVTFTGRMLQGSECVVSYGDLESKVTTITVTSDDKKSTTVYKIQFQRAPSTNATLAEVTVNGELLSDFRPGQTAYNVELPYGTTAAPVIGYTPAEDGQVAAVTQATSPTGKATIVVTAPDGISKMTYTFNFSIGKLKDVTLQDIKVNGKSVLGFTPSQAVYKVSLPVGTPTLTVEPVSAYPKGEQTITVTPNPLPTGDAINGTTVQIVVSAPGATSPKTYKLNIKIEESSYAYLADLQVVGDQVASINPSKVDDPLALAFDPEVTTYYVNLKMGTKSLPQILYTPGDEFQTITKDEGGIDGTTRLTVLAGNKSDQTVYKLVFSTAKSEISTLTNILVGGEPLEGFAPDKTNYTYELPIGTTELPEITPVANDEFQEISVTTGGVNGKTRISVTAGNGNTTNYYITFSVKKYDDNTLKSLSVGPYYALQDENFRPVAFDPQRNDYWVKLEKDSLPTVQYELQSKEYQDTVVIYPTSSNGKYKLTVRPRNGVSRTYTIQFVYRKSDNVALSMIYVADTLKHDTVALPDFAPDKTDYTFTLDTGTTVMPDVLFEAGEASQTITKAWDKDNKRVIRITVVAESGAKRTYKIKFLIPSSASTQLDNILLIEGTDTIDLPGFKKDVYEYTYSLTGATCPKILVKPGTEEQQVTITAPYAAGLATILVKMDENSSQYTIDFVKIPAATVQLQSILINGVALEGFDPTQLTYTGLNYADSLPEVKGVAAGIDDVPVRWKENTAYLLVEDAAGNKAIYSLAFTRVLSGDNTLDGIYADGVLISGFDKTRLNYSFDLAAGSTYPVISYKASSDAQTVIFGQLADGKWGITVMAENGDMNLYTVQYNIAKYNDATLKNMSLEGYALTPAFASNIFDYAVTIDEGAELPKLSIETREGQTILQNNVNDKKQQVTVFAESGANNTYTVTYTRVKSSNALLKDILINGVSLEGFDPAKADYIDSLAWRTTVVPNVFPIGQLSNQTITTYFSRPNGVTKIHVEAQDGTAKDYTIAFPVRKSANTALGDLMLDSEDAEIKFKADQTDYEVIIPYTDTICPKMIYEAAEPEQRIDVISRAIGQTSQIIVTAENGDTRTYNILFKRDVLKTANTLQAIYICLDNDLNKVTEFKKPKTLRDTTLAVPYGTRSLTVNYEKSYPEQTVFVQPGGVKAPTVITVKANNDSIKDVVYTITPNLSTQNPAVLNSIKVDGVDVPGFDPNRYTYIVNRTVTTYPKVTVTRNSGVEYEPETSMQKWIGTVSKDGYTNVYKIFFHYTNEVIPNGEFSEWDTQKEAVEHGGLFGSDKPLPKPAYWNVPGDYIDRYLGTAEAGPSVQKESETIVHLNNTYWAALAGPVPAVMNLGTMTAKFAVAGATSTTPSGFISFHNTPDVAKINYKYTNKAGNGALFRFKFFDVEGEEHPFDHTQTSTKSSYAEYSLNLATDGLGVSGMDIIIDASGKYPEGSNTADLYVDYIRFVYNSTPKEAWANGIKATLSGKTFTVTLTDPEDINLPSYEFKGEVSDQAQLVTWSAPFAAGEEFEVRQATIVNYAEDGTSTTGYKLQVKRPFDKTNVLKTLLIGGDTLNTFQADKTDYTVSIPSKQRHLPDVQPVLASSLQTVTTTYNEADSTMTITVKPEKGSIKTYTVKFVTELSDDVTLKSVTAEGVSFDPEVTSYDITATRLPLISFEKRSDRQTVVLNNGVLTVTAENGKVGTYTINRLDPAITPNGTISEFEQKGNVLTDLGGTAYEKEAAKPADYISFTRAQIADSVIFVQSPAKMTWSVPTTGIIYSWNYPTALSTNADLAHILIGGSSYEDFMPNEVNYELSSDTTLVIVTVPAEETQTLTTTLELVDGGVLYSTTVQPQSGAPKTYKVKVTRPMDGTATLNGILLDSVLIDGFASDKFNYSYTLPAPQGAKTEQPKMPNITYAVGHPGQKVTIVPGELNGDETTFTVKSEDGNAIENYYLNIKAEKSHCSDLTGITVNGVALDYFEPGRHHYSVSLSTNSIEMDYTSDDRFQTVTTHIVTVKADHEYHYTLHVVAEDGTSSDYLVEIYVENQSNDAQLANILLNNRSMDKFEPLYNSDIFFDGGNNNYELRLPATSKMPEVSAQLKMDGQKVDIEHRRDEHLNIDSILLHVTAVDGLTLNTYVLRFVRPLSSNSQLSMIEINNEPIDGFSPTTYFYAYDMSSSESTPRITVETADEFATAGEPDYSQEGRVTITVYAQDYTTDPNHKSVYTIAVNIKKSDVATLDMLYEGRDSLPGFEPNKFYYAYELEAHETFPDLSWQDPDNYPTVSPIDTVEYDPIAQKLVRQIKVTAEDTTVSNIYTIAYTIKKSDVDTLQMIFVGSKPLPGFKADVLEYEYKLTASEVVTLDGELPVIDPIPGEEGKQIINTLQVRDNYGVKTVGYKHVITVTAAAGNSRTYTIHYPRELSDDATLKMIFIDESPLPNFDAERNSYKIELDYGVPVPNITEATKDFQTVKHRQSGDTVEVIVTAELDSIQNTYTIVFERRKSNITALRNIILMDKEQKQLPYDRFAFQSKEYEYTIVMPYDPQATEDVLPAMTIEKADSLQTVQISQQQVSKNEIQVIVHVIAPNGEDEGEYLLLFRFMRNDDALLTGISIALTDSTSTPIKGFKSTTYNYTYVHPYGSDSSQFIRSANVKDVISYVKSDMMATDTMFVEENGTIRIVVTAQDEKTQNTYSIMQTIGKDNVNLLKMIYLDDEEYADFDPEQTFYVYKLRNGSGSCPAIKAVPMSENAEVSITEMPVNDTTVIYCTAQDGSDRVYKIFFEESDVNDGLSATENDVFLRRIPGTYQLFVATIRKDVTFVMYDQYGHMVFYQQIPDADPNAIDVAPDAFEKDVLLGVDVNPNAGILVDIIPGQIYFYAFVKGASAKRIKSGKIIAQ